MVVGMICVMAPSLRFSRSTTFCSHHARHRPRGFRCGQISCLFGRLRTEKVLTSWCGLAVGRFFLQTTWSFCGIAFDIVLLRVLFCVLSNETLVCWVGYFSVLCHWTSVVFWSGSQEASISPRFSMHWFCAGCGSTMWALPKHAFCTTRASSRCCWFGIRFFLVKAYAICFYPLCTEVFFATPGSSHTRCVSFSSPIARGIRWRTQCFNRY